MPGVSLTNVLGGPCLITYRGATFRSKGDVTLNEAIPTFAVETSIYGQVDKRVIERQARISFTPDGEWTNLAVLWPYAAFPMGSFLTPQVTLGTVAGGQANVGSTAALQTGDAVVVQNYNGTITGGLTAGNTYYIRVISSSLIGFYTTYANAIAGTNAIAITAGSGTTRFVVNNPLSIQSLDGILRVYGNVAVVKMPSLSLSTTKTAIGEVEFEAFIADGQDWNGTNSLYTETFNPYPGDTGFQPANILTGEISAVWGNVAPWNPFDTKEGWQVDFKMSLSAVEADNVGLLTRRLNDLEVTAKAMPIGVQPSDVDAALYLQGTNAARGRSLAAFGNNLLLSAVSGQLGCKLYNAALMGGPIKWSNKLDRVGELTWIATRTFGQTGPNPLFYIGSATVT